MLSTWLKENIAFIWRKLKAHFLRIQNSFGVIIEPFCTTEPNQIHTYNGIEATTPAEKWIFQILIFHPSLLLRVPL